MTAPASTQTVDLVARFPGVVTAETRPGYSGFIVEKDNLVEVATAIRDEFGFDLLTAVTAVDYLPENKMEVVYHAYKTTGGLGLVFRVQVLREDPIEVPSLIEVYPGADLQEREAWDLMGIKFTGHPDLRRILMWEGYEGHPLRKDWQEPFYEEDNKPFKSRWPDGKHTMAETKNPFNDNLKFPQNFDPEKWVPENDEMLYQSLKRYTVESEDGLGTDRIVVNMGPQHPSTHGVFRAAITLDGETIVGLKPVVGYLQHLPAEHALHGPS